MKLPMLHCGPYDPADPPAHSHVGGFGHVGPGPAKECYTNAFGSRVFQKCSAPCERPDPTDPGVFGVYAGMVMGEGAF